jgi:nickel/cobalt transporter (NiCoT) family protein
VFLWVIGILNLALLGILKVFREMRHGSYDEAAHRIPSARRAPVV